MQEKIILSGNLIVKDDSILLLYRPDHAHYETPGGKVRESEVKNFTAPSVEELRRTAQRELKEELGDDIVSESMDYFGKVEVVIPGNRLAVAHKFITTISGNPQINEPELFSKLDYLPIDRLEEFSISPDLRLFVKKIQEYVRKK